MIKKVGPYAGKTFDQYYIDQYISSGNFAVVYKCHPIKSSAVQPQYMAIKIYEHSEYEQIKEYVTFQIQTLKKIRSPYVIKCYGSFEYQQSNKSPILHCVLMEYCNGGTLQNFFEQNREKNNERMVRKFLKQILEGVRSVHQVNAMHRDIKGQNIMLHDGIIKIIDFGLGKGSQGQLVGETYAGTPHTMAPEIKKVKENKGGTYDKNVDIYSIGVVAYQMIEGNFMKQYNKRLQFHNMQVSSQMQSFLAGCLEEKPEKRFTWKQIMQHPLYTDSGSSIIKFKNEDEFDFLIRSSNNNTQFLPMKDTFNSIDDQNQMKNSPKNKIYDLDISKISEQNSMEYPSFSKIQQSKKSKILPQIQSIRSKPNSQPPQNISLLSQKNREKLYPQLVSIKSKQSSKHQQSNHSSSVKQPSIYSNSQKSNSNIKKKSRNSSMYDASVIITQLQQKQRFQQIYKNCNEERDRLIYSLDQTFSIDTNFKFFDEIDDSQFAKFQFFSYKRVYLAIKKMLSNLNEHKNILNVEENIWEKFCQSQYFTNLVQQITEIVRQLKQNTQEAADELEQEDEKLMKQSDPDIFYINEEVFEQWYINILKITYEDLVNLFKGISEPHTAMKTNDLIKICSIILYNIENKDKIGYAYEIESTISKPAYRNAEFHYNKADEFQKYTTFEFLYPK